MACIKLYLRNLQCGVSRIKLAQMNIRVHSRSESLDQPRHNQVARED
jgi:hypothetical protein